MAVKETFGYFLETDPNTQALPLPAESTDRIPVVRAGVAYYATLLAAPPSAGVTIHDTTALLSDFSGFLWVDNTSGGAIVVTMPPVPANGQLVVVKDATGNAGTHTITVAGGGGILIEGSASLALTVDYSWLYLVFSGVQWVQV